MVIDDAAVLSALERGGRTVQEEDIVGVAADLRSPAGCWRGKEPLLTVVLHRFTGRDDAVLAVSRAHSILDGISYCSFMDTWAREVRGEAAASGTIDAPQSERRAGVRSRPWGHSYLRRLRRAEALRAEDTAFCSALRDQCAGLSCRLRVEFSSVELEALRRAATPPGATALVTTQVALTAHALLTLLTLRSFGQTPRAESRVRVGVLIDARRFLPRADAFGNWYFCAYVCWSLDHGRDATGGPRQQLVEAAAALARGLEAVDNRFALHALSHATFLDSPPAAVRRVCVALHLDAVEHA